MARVALHPFSFSRTDLESNPSPVFVAAAGAAWGVVAPLLAWMFVHAKRAKCAFLARAFAGFCLIANGAYLLSAGILPIGDAADLVRLGVPIWILMSAGLLGCAGGLAAWNELGKAFGLSGGVVDRSALHAALLALTITLLITILSWHLTRGAGEISTLRNAEPNQHTSKARRSPTKTHRADRSPTAL